MGLYLCIFNQNGDDICGVEVGLYSYFGEFRDLVSKFTNKEVKCVEYVREIFAQYDRQCIRVYQAYNPIIAKEAISLQTFGENFDVNRMTWIKPSFLWLMHRSNWGTKKIRNVF